jgi:excisionase family DNA binding protein
MPSKKPPVVAATKAAPDPVEHIPDLVPKAIVAHDCGVTPRTIEWWVRTRKIPCVRIGHRTIRFRLADVRRALAKLTVKEVS